jgi:hypothetical protein
VSLALDRELDQLQYIRWNTKVSFVNRTPYASQVEEGLGPLDEFGRQTYIREVNKLASYGGVAMLGYVEMKYSNLRYIKKLAV